MRCCGFAVAVCGLRLRLLLRLRLRSKYLKPHLDRNRNRNTATVTATATATPQTANRKSKAILKPAESELTEQKHFIKNRNSAIREMVVRKINLHFIFILSKQFSSLLLFGLCYCDDFLFLIGGFSLSYELRYCGLGCGVAVCGCGVAVAVLRFDSCGLVAVAVCGLRLRLRLGLNTAFRGLV